MRCLLSQRDTPLAKRDRVLFELLFVEQRQAHDVLRMTREEIADCRHAADYLAHVADAPLWRAGKPKGKLASRPLTPNGIKHIVAAWEQRSGVTLRNATQKRYRRQAT